MGGAAPAVVDPACDAAFSVTGFITVIDTDETPAGLPAQVTRDDMSCIIEPGGQRIYVYLDDPGTKLVTVSTSLAGDGWRLFEVAEDGTESPFDLGTAYDRALGDSLALVAHRGSDSMAVLYFGDDATSAYFSAGLFLIARPLTGTTTGGTDADDPSTLSELDTISAPTPAQGTVLVGAAAGLTVLLALPGFLLSNVLSARYDQLFGWLGRGRVGRARKLVGDAATGPRRWLVLGGGIVLASFIAGFIDPAYGVNALSLRLFLTLLATFAVFNIGAWAVVSAYLRRADPAARPVLTMHPATLIVVAVAVVVSRLLSFNPGVVFGLVAGITFAMTLVASREAMVIIVGSAYALAIAIAAWVGYSLLAAVDSTGSPALVALSEFFAGVTVEGVSTLPLALAPFAALDGAALFRWRKWVWALSYAIGLAAFMYVLFNVPGGTAQVDGDFARWIVIFTVFVLIAVAVWLIDWAVRRRAVARA